MPDLIDRLKFKIVIALSEMSSESCTVTNFAKILAVEKYSVSRALISLEREGLVNRSNIRQPVLTGNGEQAAKRYRKRLDIALNHLIYEGVDPSYAQQDALLLAMYCSDKTFSVIQGSEERQRMKYIFRRHRQFDGSVLCERLKDGIYHFPFIIYREKAVQNSNISMANDGFEHPFRLLVSRDKGIIQLNAIPMIAFSRNGIQMSGKIQKMQYYDGEKYCDAERNRDFLQFPAEVLRFIHIGDESAEVLHGSVGLKMTCSVGLTHMPESTAIFTVLI